MMLVRLALTLPAGGALSAGMFWVLWTLISEPINIGDTFEAVSVEFTRMRRDTEAQTRREERVEREPPPPIPDMPNILLSIGGVQNNVAQLNPIIDASGAMSGLTLSAGSDTDVIPLVRIAPEYPPRALARSIEGWVQVRFTITETGAVANPMVVDADPEGVFDEAALRSIARWRYNPRVEGGVAVERVGVETIIRFQLEQ